MPLPCTVFYNKDWTYGEVTKLISGSTSNGSSGEWEVNHFIFYKQIKFPSTFRNSVDRFSDLTPTQLNLQPLIECLRMFEGGKLASGFRLQRCWWQRCSRKNRPTKLQTCHLHRLSRRQAVSNIRHQHRWCFSNFILTLFRYWYPKQKKLFVCRDC